MVYKIIFKYCYKFTIDFLITDVVIQFYFLFLNLLDSPGSLFLVFVDNTIFITIIGLRGLKVITKDTCHYLSYY